MAHVVLALDVGAKVARPDSRVQRPGGSSTITVASVNVVGHSSAGQRAQVADAYRAFPDTADRDIEHLARVEYHRRPVGVGDATVTVLVTTRMVMPASC